MMSHVGVSGMVQGLAAPTHTVFASIYTASRATRVTELGVGSAATPGQGRDRQDTAEAR